MFCFPELSVYPVRCYTVSMLLFYNFLTFQYIWIVNALLKVQQSDSTARTVPFNRLLNLCYAALFPTYNVRTIAYCFFARYWTTTLFSTAVFHCETDTDFYFLISRGVIFTGTPKRSSDCTYFFLNYIFSPAESIFLLQDKILLIDSIPSPC